MCGLLRKPKVFVPEGQEPGGFAEEGVVHTTFKLFTELAHVPRMSLASRLRER